MNENKGRFGVEKGRKKNKARRSKFCIVDFLP